MPAFLSLTLAINSKLSGSGAKSWSAFQMNRWLDKQITRVLLMRLDSVKGSVVEGIEGPSDLVPIGCLSL